MFVFVFVFVLVLVLVLVRELTQRVHRASRIVHEHEHDYEDEDEDEDVCDYRQNKSMNLTISKTRRPLGGA